MQAPKKGNIFIISAASGTGKTTLVSHLLKNNADLRVSISHTTRPPREGEQNGVHYHFVPKAEFESLIAQQAFLEHANVFGNYYGTSIAGVNDLSAQGYDVILEIDVQGAEQVRQALPEACSIFILPPSLDILAGRLKGRGTDSEEVIHTRLAEARREIEQAAHFDYIVVNDDLDKAEADLLHIINARRLQKAAQQAFLAKLLENS
ncbi:guanylate kinase [Neisseria perflava]|uniref:guanylate kinase n=1 Tax=Neisseria perflava TaxID=33053 RepID=UPI0020A1C119|nr:guanylate kinase [Neisseria perflava]MCP1659770.1 guanylate kinase [Neisseria perflava]MCP1771631.1 guanylate kinase [Neisseria perflava]